MSKRTHDGETLGVAEWAKRAGISAPTMYARLQRMSLGEALTLPSKSRSKPGPEQPEETTHMAAPTETEKAPVQRKVDLPCRAAKADPIRQGKRVKVYHKRRTTMFLSDCKIGPHEERDILLSDWENPAVAEHVIKVA